MGRLGRLRGNPSEDNSNFVTCPNCGKKTGFRIFMSKGKGYRLCQKCNYDFRGKSVVNNLRIRKPFFGVGDKFDNILQSAKRMLKK